MMGAGFSCYFYLIGRNFEAGVSATYMSQKLACLAFMFQLAGQRDATKAFVVRRAMRGYRVGRSATDTRRPVSFLVLGSVVGQLSVVCLSGYERALFRAVFVLAFFGAFRVGKLVSKNRRSEGGLWVQNVWVWGDSLGVFLRWSKMYQQGRGAWVELKVVPFSPVCPGTAVWDFSRLRCILQA